MKLQLAELDGGMHFHGYAVDDTGKWLFDVKLVQQLSGRGVCIVECLDDQKKYMVDLKTV